MSPEAGTKSQNQNWIQPMAYWGKVWVQSRSSHSWAATPGGLMSADLVSAWGLMNHSCFADFDSRWSSRLLAASLMIVPLNALVPERASGAQPATERDVALHAGWRLSTSAFHAAPRLNSDTAVGIARRNIAQVIRGCMGG